MASEIKLPEKLYFSIGEVSSLTQVEPHTLRYWESEFKLLTPKKNKAGKRVYTKKNVEDICYIKQLLYKERYTIEGAKKKLRSLSGEEKEDMLTEESKTVTDISFLQGLKEDITMLKNFIDCNCL